VAPLAEPVTPSQKVMELLTTDPRSVEPAGRKPDGFPACFTSHDATPAAVTPINMLKETQRDEEEPLRAAWSANQKRLIGCGH